MPPARRIISAYSPLGRESVPAKHITVSLAKNAKPVKTKDLDFIRLTNPIPVKGRFGYWISEKKQDGFICYNKVLEEQRTLK